VTDPRITIGLQQTVAAAEPVAAALDSIRPVVRIGGQVHPSAAAAAAALVSMLARIHPHTAVDGDAPVGPSPWAAGTVQAVLARLDGVQPAATRPPEHDFVIGVGTSGPADLWVGGDDWTVLLGRDEQPIGAGSTGYGIWAAAALAAAEVLRVTLGPLGFIHRPVGERFVWNLIDHQLRPAPVTAAVGPPPPLVLFGAGSVNSSAAAMLAMLPRAGMAVVVDPDMFDPRRNPYRYPAALPTTMGGKAGWVAGILRGAGWRVRPSRSTLRRGRRASRHRDSGESHCRPWTAWMPALTSPMCSPAPPYRSGWPAWRCMSNGSIPPTVPPARTASTWRSGTRSPNCSRSPT
jgi:hypothetical protein